MGRRRPLYVETLIRASVDDLWRLTQDPDEHQRWDLRFTRIEHVPWAIDDGRRRFRYSVSLLPGLRFEGTGVCAGERLSPDGTRTSVLRFASGQRLSLIRSGTGYWRYVPAHEGIRFLTGYDYEPGWGPFGVLSDWTFRPIMGWATAWSFDRLRLWLENGIPPEKSLRRWMVDAGLRIAVSAGAWRIIPGPFAGLLTLAVFRLPARRSVPSARRCLRRPPDRLSGRCPAELHLLAPSAAVRPARSAASATASPSAARPAAGSVLEQP